MKRALLNVFLGGLLGVMAGATLVRCSVGYSNDDHGEILPDGALECQNLCRTKTVIAFANDELSCECEWP